MKIKKNIACAIFCKYSKYMSGALDPEKDIEKSQQSSQFSLRAVYVREDDQDWGSSGMNDIKQEHNIS